MTSSKTNISQKNKRIGIAILCAVVILIVVCFLGFRDGGWFRKKTYDAQAVQSLMDYAKQLEDAGNSEAAAAVYELIAKYGGGDLIPEAYEDIPLLKADNEIEQFKEFISGGQEGDGQ